MSEPAGTESPGWGQRLLDAGEALGEGVVNEVADEAGNIAHTAVSGGEGCTTGLLRMILLRPAA